MTIYRFLLLIQKYIHISLQLEYPIRDLNEAECRRFARFLLFLEICSFQERFGIRLVYGNLAVGLGSIAGTVLVVNFPGYEWNRLLDLHGIYTSNCLH